MAQSLANFDNALKNIYAPGLKNAINNSNPVLTEVVRDEENVQGRKAIWSVHSGRSASTGARAEAATLPTADRQRYLAPEDTLAYNYHTIKVTGQAIRLTRGNAGSFTRALEAEMRGAERDLKNDIARQMFNQAKTINLGLANGVIATVNAATPSNPLALDDDGTTLPASIMRHFFVGMKVDFVTPGTGAISSANRTITATDVANRTITLDSVAGVADNDYIFRAGNYASGENEINGLRFLIGTQNYAGITAASNPVWNGNTAGSSTEGISEDLLEEAKEKVMTDGDGSDINLFLAEPSQARKLASVLKAQRRFDGRTRRLPAGWEGVDVAGATLVTDRYCPTTTIFGLTTSALGWFVGQDWEWDDTGGSVLYKALDNTDAAEARFLGYHNLNAYVRNAHVLITVAAPTF